MNIGPLWLPFIGCLSTFQRQYKKHRYTHLVFQKLAKEYGPVIGLKLGKQKIVVVTNYEYVKKALCMKELDGRPDGFFFKLRSFGKRKGNDIFFLIFQFFKKLIKIDK